MHTRLAVVALTVTAVLAACQAEPKSKHAGSAQPVQPAEPRSTDAMAGPRIGASAVEPSAVVNGYCAVNHTEGVQGGRNHARWVSEWRGQRVGFCCEDCLDAWRGMTDDQREKNLADALKHGGMN